MKDEITKRVKIRQIISLTDESKSFILEPLDNWKPVYKSGQFLTLIFKTKSGEKRRSYSISSTPELKEPLTITVKKVDNGEFSRMLIYSAKEGDIMNTTGISGLFTLQHDRKPGPLFFLAAGSGITPCFSLIKSALLEGKSRIILVYSNKSEKDTIFYNDLTLLQKQYPDKFSIRFLFSHLDDVRKSRLSNWLLQQLLLEFIPEELNKTHFYVCGPYDYRLMISITLKAAGVPHDHIIKEDFNPLPPPTLVRPHDVSPHQVTIHLNGKIHRILVQYPVSITSSAKAAGLRLPFSCEAGRCGSCVATCLKGKIWMAYNEVLMDNEIARGRVLTCVGYPVDGDAEIQFD